MTQASADRTVVMMGTVAVGSIFIGSIYPCGEKEDSRPQCGQLPGIRPMLGALFAFGIMSAISNPAPELATGFALAVGTVAYLSYASPIINEYFGTQAKPKLKNLNNPTANALNKFAQRGK